MELQSNSFEVAYVGLTTLGKTSQEPICIKDWHKKCFAIIATFTTYEPASPEGECQDF